MRFFFFQAEDGIRDDLVTGVQTCALPILTFVIESYGKLEQLSSPVPPSKPPIRSACGWGAAATPVGVESPQLNVRPRAQTRSTGRTRRFHFTTTSPSRAQR